MKSSHCLSCEKDAELINGCWRCPDCKRLLSEPLKMMADNVDFICYKHGEPQFIWGVENGTIVCTRCQSPMEIRIARRPLL